MAIITFAELHAEVAAWHAREAAEQLPLARACRALDTLRDVLPLLSGQDRADVLDGIRGLLADEDKDAWFDAIAPRDHVCRPRTGPGLKTRR